MAKSAHTRTASGILECLTDSASKGIIHGSLHPTRLELSTKGVWRFSCCRLIQISKLPHTVRRFGDRPVKFHMLMTKSPEQMTLIIHHCRQRINCVDRVLAENPDGKCSMGLKNYQDRSLLGAYNQSCFLFLLAGFQFPCSVRLHLFMGSVGPWTDKLATTCLLEIRVFPVAGFDEFVSLRIW